MFSLNLTTLLILRLTKWLSGEEFVSQAGDLGLIPRLGRSPGEGEGFPLQYSGLENSTGYVVHGVTKSWTQLCDFHFHFPLPVLNPAWTSGSSQFMDCWSLAWRVLSITLLMCEMSVLWQFEHSLALPFFEIWMKTDLFQSSGHCWVFQIYCHVDCSTFTASSFKIWNSITSTSFVHSDAF